MKRKIIFIIVQIPPESIAMVFPWYTVLYASPTAVLQPNAEGYRQRTVSLRDSTADPSSPIRKSRRRVCAYRLNANNKFFQKNPALSATPYFS